VIGLGKKQPDGAKIANLRKQKGLKQAALAKEVRISERLLRDIEAPDSSSQRIEI
jgi:transcriptional regulator with XRE-family HTH domain